MTGLLLDSHIVWWRAAAPGELRADALAAIKEPGRYVALSVATMWELEIKQAAGKLRLFEEFWPPLKRAASEILDITRADAFRAARLPVHHRDPFDRMIIAQALNRDLTVVTRDAAFSAYGVPLLAA